MYDVYDPFLEGYMTHLMQPTKWTKYISLLGNYYVLSEYHKCVLPPFT